MASHAEQLAASLNLGAFSKATELKKRLWFTLMAVIVYRIGTYIPLPGVDPQAMAHIFQQKGGGGILDMFNMFSGGALQRMTIFALNVMPYVSASIILQMMSAAVPALDTLKKEGEAGRKRMNQYTRYLTVILAAVQGYGLAFGIEAMGRSSGHPAVIDPGFFFRVTTTITLIGGTVFLMWLGEQITARGIGQGVSVIIFSGIVANLPRALIQLLDLARTGAISTPLMLGAIILVVAVIAFIVFMERAQRRVVIQYPKRNQGNKVSQAQSTFMPLKVNNANVMPPILASALLSLPLTALGFLGADKTGWLGQMSAQLSPGRLIYTILYTLMIVYFTFFYTAIAFNPAETADNLRKNGAFVPGIKPGKNTADYLDYVLTRISVLGAAYLVAVCLFPQFLISHFALPFYLGGTSLLIAVTIPLDIMAQIHSHLIAQQYETRFKKARLRGRTR